MPEERPDTGLVDALCPMCQRKAYVREDAEMVCPVCSSPLLLLTAGSETQAS